MSANRDDYRIRQYLLGQLTGEEREEFERRLFAEDELFEQLQTAEDDLVDDYLTGDLSENEVALFQKNFLVGSKREREVRIGKAWRNFAAVHAGEKPPVPVHAPVSKWRQFFSSFNLKTAASMGVVLIVASATYWIFFYQSDVDKGLSALDAAYRQERPLESRITRLSYAPFAGTRGSSSGVNQDELDQADLTLRTLVKNKPTSAARHALGKVYLAKKEFDKAIDQFEQALKGDQSNAQIHADLGAALLEKGKVEVEKAKTAPDDAQSGKGAESFARSLEQLNAALKLDANLLEALFNRALLYESMGLIPQAEEEWRKYIERDPNSKWTNDAGVRLEEIEKARQKTSLTNEQIFQVFLKQLESGDEDGASTTVSKYQNRTGNVVVEQLIDGYLTAASHNQKEAADLALQRLSHVGDLQLRKTEDRYFSDLARFYRTLTSEQRESVVRAHEWMKSGYEGWGKLGTNENRILFENARELFERARDYPEARIAEYWISFCYFRLHDQTQSRRILDPVELASENQKYLWLQARVLYLRSAIEFDLNEHSHALDFGRRAARVAKRINDPVGLLNAESSLIEYYRYLGSYEESLACIQRSVPLITATTLDPIQGNRHYGFAALAFTSIGFPDAAMAHRLEASRFGMKTGSDEIKAQNYAVLGMINGKLKDFDEAVKNVQLAIDLAQARSNQSLTAYSALQMGHIYRDARDFDKAVSEYTRSIEIYERDEFKTHLFQAHKGRLFCYLLQQNDSLAREEISRLLYFMEKYRSQITDENYRNTFFDVEQSVFDAAVDFEYSRMNNPEQAFEYSNLARARSLLDLLNADKDVKARVQDADIKIAEVSKPVALEAIVKQLPEQTQLLQYYLLPDKLLMWVISRNGFQVRMQPVSKKELNEKLLRFMNIVSRPPTGDETQELALAKDLYTVLVQPVAQLLDKEKLLCIIPDATLSYLPFAALVSPQSNNYLFEEHALMTSPSASVFLSCAENALRNGGPRVERVLSVGNPTFDRAAFPDFQNLPEAGREAEEVRGKYKSGDALTENEPTRAAVKNEIEKADVLHLALHSSIDDEVPLRSKLLLAKTKTQSDSVVYAYEIYNLRLSRARLAILASCQSGAGPYYGGEGVSSLARAFIGAGVPLVVASLWPVESRSTEKLMVSFHGYRTEKRVPTVEALRSAQREMLRGPGSNFHRPYYWAGFSVTGGYATF
jgi:CHAT domain-containing protein/lipopolysaccharide biosynthesis regulator YciM